MNMKTIGKKIKAIYFLAVIAIVSMCMAILPFMSTNVKAETQDVGLNVVGAKVIVIDDTTDTQDFNGKYAVSFQAEFTTDLYGRLNVRGNAVKFGMLVGPAANYADVTIETAEENGFVDSCFLGNKDCEQYISFGLGETTCKYEASIEYDEADIVEGLEDAAKLDAVLAQSSQELAAIPYYMVNGEVTLVKVANPLVRTARRLINDAYAFSDKVEFGDELFARYVGAFDDEFSGREYYVEKSTGKVYMSNANNELVPFYAQNFVAGGQLVVNLENAEAEDLDFLTLDADTMETLAVGQDYSIAAFLDDADNTVKTIKAKVVTKVISKFEDFFVDINDDEMGDVALENYIFKLEAIKNSYDGNHTTPDVIEGYYVLGANIDAEDNTNLIPSSGDKRYVLNTSRSGFMATLDGRGFAISNVNVANCSSGMFGLLNGATIKNIAFYDIVTSRNDGTPGLLAHGTYNTTFENVYIKLKEYTGNYGDNYVSTPKVFGGISDKYGASSFTNVIYENSVALTTENTKKYNRVQFTGDTTSVYENTTVIGLPATYSRSAFVKVENIPEPVEEGETPEISLDEYYTADTLILTLPIDDIKSFVGADKGAGKYALADYENVSTTFAKLIARVNAEGTYDTNVDENKDETVDFVRHYTTDIQFIEFVEDTARNYYLDNAGLAADAEVVNAYIETGFWKIVDDQLVWASSEANTHVYVEKEKVVEICTYSYTIYECSCGCGDIYHDDYIKPIHDYKRTIIDPTCEEPGQILGECTLCDASYVIDIEPGHVYEVTVVPATCGTDGYTSYVCVCGDEIIEEVEAFGHTADENEEFCTVCGEFIGEANFYDQNEFVIDKSTGKVYRADANNELKSYDATSFLGEETVVTIGGVEQTLVSTKLFAFDQATLETLVEGKQYLIAAGQNLLAARVVTKVFFNLADFFVDANGSGEIESAEMTNDNYIFNIGMTNDNTVDIKIEGYYVLANNIDVARNTAFSPNSGENLPSNSSADVGFQATLDGRGFAIQNARPYNRAGIFGLLKNATIKNIAFTNMINDRNDGSTYYIAYSTINTTFENVYISTGENWLGWNQANKTATAAMGGVSNSTFTNVVFENNAWKSTATNIARSENSWFYLTDANVASANVNTIGMPNVIKVEKYITVGGEARHKLIMKLPLATIRKYVPMPDIYLLDDCGGAEVDFESLINGINTGDGVNIQYIEFVEDTRLIGYYYDSAALAADTVVAETYLATGMWKVVEDALVWKSLTEKEHIYEAVVTDPTCTEYGYTTYTCACGCGETIVADFVDPRHTYEAVVTDPTCTEQGYTTYTCIHGDHEYKDDYTDPRHTYEEVVTPPTCTEDGFTTYTCIHGDHEYVGDPVPAGHDYTVVVTPPTCTEQGYTTHTCIHGDHEYTDTEVDALGHTPDAAGDLCTVCGNITREGQPYEEGAEIVIDKSTGKVFKANANKELVAYDATSYLGEQTTVTIGGTQQTVTNTTAFALDKAGLASLVDGQKVLIVAGQNLLVANVVTRVLATLEDFFVDADGSGIVEAAEMTRDNYIFNLKPQGSSGAALPSIAIKGYYVLANNIDLKNNTALCNRSTTSGDHTVQIWNGSSDVGFRATLDGRGFALKNGSPSGSSAGMFGAFYGATIKNIAFDGFTNTAGNGSGLVLGYSYNSTFENVYIRLVGNNGGDTWAGEGSWNALTIADTYGESTFNNLVVESFDGLAENKTNVHNRFAFTATTTAGTFTNTAIVGMPVTYSKYVASTTDATKYTLPITMSADAMAALGVTEGEIQLSALPEAVASAYANLIANIETKRTIDIDYINFVVDSKDRDYYLDNAGLVADTAVANTFVATGYWKIVEGALVWASL